MSNVQTKYTQRIVDQFRHELLNRREHLYETIDSLNDSDQFLIDLVNEEVDRINNIFKLMEKGKI